MTGEKEEELLRTLLSTGSLFVTRKCNCGIGSSLGANWQVFLDSIWAVGVFIYSILFEVSLVRVDSTIDIRFFLVVVFLHMAEAPPWPFPRKNNMTG